LSNIEKLKNLTIELAYKAGSCPKEYGLSEDPEQVYDDTCTGDCKQCWKTALAIFGR